MGFLTFKIKNSSMLNIFLKKSLSIPLIIALGKIPRKKILGMLTLKLFKGAAKWRTGEKNHISISK